MGEDEDMIGDRERASITNDKSMQQDGPSNQLRTPPETPLVHTGTNADAPILESIEPDLTTVNQDEPRKELNHEVPLPTKILPAGDRSYPSDYIPPPPPPLPYYQDRSRSPSSVDYRRYRRRRPSYDEPYRAPDPQKRVPAIPELGRVQWFDFKNKYVDEKQEYAIEVLVGEPKYYYQRQSEKDRGSLQNNEIGTELMLQRSSSAPADLPERIRINSWSLLAILSNLASEDWTLKPRVMLRPFKLLSFFEKEIREKLSDLEADWGEEACKADETDGAEEDLYYPPGRRQVPDSDPRKLLGKKLTDSVEALRDMRCLVDFIDQYIKPTKERLRDPSTQKVRYTDLWYLFILGEEVYEIGRREQSSDGEPAKVNRHRKTNQCLWNICSTAGGRRNLSAPAFGDESSPLGNKPHLFRVDCYYIDFNGIEYVACSKAFIIHPFEGERDITSLDIFPIKFSRDAQMEKERATERGKLFLEYKQWKQRYYRGPTLTRHPSGEMILGDNAPKNVEEIDSQVIVDFDEALDNHPNWFPEIGLYGNQPTKFRQFEEDYRTITWKSRERKQLHDESNDLIYNDESIDNKWMIHVIINDPFLERFQSANKVTELRPENLFLLPGRVFAYVLQKRKFAQLKLEPLKPVKPQKEAFDALKLPRRTKDTIQALVRSHFEKKHTLDDDFDQDDDGEIDLVRGKGKGLIVLLHGAPGVGKTSTAECMAHYTGKPLLPITCGDLGLTAANVESQLERIFRLASKWTCVLLLDEADVFLARREIHDLERNSLVSQFLRALEYYVGLLFLTTNRVGAFDEAFKSRIHIKLYYPPLDPPQTKAIWKEFLKRTINNKKGTVQANESEILAWAMNHFNTTSAMKVHWNGRQIRNAFQTATALAEYDALHPNEPQRMRGKRPATATTGRETSPPPTASPPTPKERPIAYLRPSHFDIVAQASLEFDQYFEETLGMDPHDYAHRRGERADHWAAENTMPPPGGAYGGYGMSYGSAPPPLQAAPTQRRPSVQQSGNRGGGYGYPQPAPFSNSMPPPPRPRQSDNSGGYGQPPPPRDRERRDASRSRKAGPRPPAPSSVYGDAPPTPHAPPGYGWPAGHGQGQPGYYDDEDDDVGEGDSGFAVVKDEYGGDEYDD